MVAGHLVTSLTHIVQDYYIKRALMEREYNLPLLQDSQAHDEIISEGNGYIARWFRWDKMGLADDISYGTDLATPKTATTTQVVGQLRLFGAYSTIDPFGDKVRFAKVLDHLYEAYREMAQRTAQSKTRGAIVVGSSFFSGGSESFSAATPVYAGQAATFADLVAAQTQCVTDDFFRLRGKLQRAGAKPFDSGRYRLQLNPWVNELLLQDPKFREILAGTDAKAFKEGEMIPWGGFDLVSDDMPWREDGATENTFAGSGNVITCLAYGKDAFGTIKLGKKGIAPVWKVTDTSNVPLVQLTLGWALPFGAVELKSDWAFAYKSVIPGSIAADSSS